METVCKVMLLLRYFVDNHRKPGAVNSIQLIHRYQQNPLRNDKVMGAKIPPAMISGIVTRDSPFSCWPTCHVSMFLATVPEVKMKK